MTSEQISVCWNSFHKNMLLGMKTLLENEDFVDVTLAVEGRYLKAHKMVLSVWSSYFKELFKTSPCKHPIVFLKDVSYATMSQLLQFMYEGEVQLSQENFSIFSKTAECLQIKLNCGNVCLQRDSDSFQKEIELEILTSENSVSKEVNNISSKSTNKHEFIKTEPVSVETTSSAVNNEEIQFKSEPEDLLEEKVDDNSTEIFVDPLAEDVNEDSWMMEDDYEELNVDMNVDAMPIEEESILSDSEDAGKSTVSLSKKSKGIYEHAFARFEQWCTENNIKIITETALMTYFEEKSENCKSSSLGPVYSMLRNMILIKKNVDISKYRNLLAYVKRKCKGYKPKKSETFKKEDFVKFLKEANNDTYLMMKVALIIGVVGACRRNELTHLLMENVIDEGNVIRICVPDVINNISKEFVIKKGNIENVNLVEIVRKYINIRPSMTACRRFFLSYRHGKCTHQPVGINSIGSIPKKIAHFLKLPNPEQYTGHCFKSTSSTLKRLNFL